MHYLFVDETYRPQVDPQTIVVGAWAVDQGVMSNRLERIRALHQPGRQTMEQRIEEALDYLDAQAIVAWSDLGRDFFRRGNRYSTSDVKDVSISGVVWSVAVVFAIATILLQFGRSRLPVGTVDVHYDPQSLKADHQLALQRTLREVLATGLRRTDRRLGTGALGQIKIRRIESVAKPQDHAPPNKLQFGTWLAHQICLRSDWIRSNDSRVRIRARDTTPEVLEGVRSITGGRSSV